MTTRPLNPRQAAFARNYVDNQGNASAAYRDAGYSANGADVSAGKLLGNARVTEEIDRLKAISARTSASTRAFVLDNLHHLATNGKPDSTKVSATIALGKTERMFVEVTEAVPGAGDVPQLRSYTLEELRELRAVMVDGAKVGQVAIEAPGEVEVLEDAKGVVCGGDGCHGCEGCRSDGTENVDVESVEVE